MPEVQGAVCAEGGAAMKRHRWPLEARDAENAERALSNALTYLQEARELLDDRIGVPFHEGEMIGREAFHLRHIRDRVHERYIPKAQARERRLADKAVQP